MTRLLFSVVILACYTAAAAPTSTSFIGKPSEFRLVYGAKCDKDSSKIYIAYKDIPITGISCVNDDDILELVDKLFEAKDSQTKSKFDSAPIDDDKDYGSAFTVYEETIETNLRELEQIDLRLDKIEKGIEELAKKPNK